MKKIIYILFAALLGAVSCTVKGPEVPQPQNDGTVTLMMHVNLPEVLVDTKATTMAETPNIDNIYVAVFGNNHYLNEYVKAVPCDAQGNKKDGYGTLVNDTDFYFKVTLSATTSKRFVHVFANGQPTMNFGYEDDIMKTLTTENPAGSYWTYLVLPHGTASIADDGSAEALPEAENLFKNLKLIRNFARVKLDVIADNFSLTGYQVYNTPTHGSVAVWSPYAEDQLDTANSGYFQNYYLKTFEDLLENYDGFMPNDAISGDAPTASTTYSDSNDKFVYERPLASSNRPYIIMQGRFSGDQKDTFYKLEFIDTEGNYLPLYRNHEYTLTISKVARSGAADPTQAKVANANVSAMTEAQDLTDISDGLSRIYVQWLDQAYMESGTKTFQYMYLPDAYPTSSSTQGTVAITDGAGKAITGSLTQTAPSSSSNYWTTVTFTTSAPDDTMKVTKFRVTGQYTATDGQVHKLYRDITVRVLPYQPWGTPKVTAAGTAVETAVDVEITLPTGLPSSLFPLEISFEDLNKVLDPAGTDMPAVIGETIVPDKSGSSYQFVKTIGFLDYSRTGGNVITANFKRVRTGASTLYIKNKYFKDGNNEVGTASIPAGAQN